MSTLEQPELHVCPACGTANELDALAKCEYRCSQCSLELAHLDVAANGVIRGIFGWLRGVGDTIENRYQVKSVLGKGGFGATYLVEDLRLSGKRRAIKEVPELLFDEYETTLLRRLNHPSIPDIIDRSVVDGMLSGSGIRRQPDFGRRTQAILGTAHPSSQTAAAVANRS